MSQEAGILHGFFHGDNPQKNSCIQFQQEFSYPGDVFTAPGIDPDGISLFDEVRHIYFQTG